MNLTLRRALTLCALVTSVFAGTPSAATAHPLGNFTVNHYTGLVIHPDRLDAVAIVDRAEISTAQEQPSIDRDANGTVDAAERRTHARTACTALTPQLHVDADGHRVTWTLTATDFSYQPGQAGLKTSRLRCTLIAAVKLRLPSDLSLRTAYDTKRIGWHEITARGQGVALADATVPTASASDELRHYPPDPLAAPLDQRLATLRVEAGASTPQLPTALPGAGPVTTLLARMSDAFDSLMGARDLTIPVGLLALLLSVVLGASHAAMPGHGKTLMAAYLAGRRGTPRDAVTIGATVTLTHTAGVLILGLALPLATHLAGETVLNWLGLASGVLVTWLGIRLLRSNLRDRLAHGHRHHHHKHGHGGDHSHHHHGHPGTPGPPGQRQDSTPATEPLHDLKVLVKLDEDLPGPLAASPKPSLKQGTLIGMGMAGGLVPSPSALVVLLGAVALGRTAFGVLLVIGYGLGMAATLTLAGLLLIKLQDRLEARALARGMHRNARRKRMSRLGPLATSTLVLIVGLGLTARALTGGL